MAGGLAGAFAFGNLNSGLSPTTDKQQVAETDRGDVNINVENLDATIGEAVAEKVTPSVVGIRTTVSVPGFFGGTQESSGEGSGVIYTEDGYIITNYHVISDAVDYGKSSEILVFLDGDTGLN